VLWILQNNLFSEPGYHKIVEILNRLEREVLYVKPVPFSSRLIPADTDTFSSESLNDIPDIPDPIGKSIVLGSYTLAKIAVERGWSPGAQLENLSYDVWKDQWEGRLLNPDARISRFADALPDSTTFIRPVEDSKSIPGKVYSPQEWATYRETVLSVCTSDDPLNADTLVILSPPVEIWSENRFWIVGGAIATYSQYKRGSVVHYSSSVDPEVISFAQECIGIWNPNRAYVLDIAQTPLGCKIVEVNCLNAAGFYAGDMGKLIDALETEYSR
jgi:hypothetical protein